MRCVTKLKNNAIFLKTVEGQREDLSAFHFSAYSMNSCLTMKINPPIKADSEEG